MNKVFLIGNLTRDPEIRQTESGISVCSFTLAVNRKSSSEHPEADYFQVSAWRGLGESCYKYLSKGKKASVIGEVRAGAYIDREGRARGTLQVTAQDVEFLKPRAQAEANPDVPAGMTSSTAGGYVEVPDEELPFE